MENLKLETRCGDRFETIAERAKSIAIEQHRVVEFNFNDILCIVSDKTDLKYLFRDYHNAHLMGWKQVTGIKYSTDIKKELSRRKKVAKEASDKRQAEYDEKMETAKELFKLKTVGVKIELSDKEAWKNYREKNKDPYGKCCVDYAESWAKLMQVEILGGKTVEDCAKETSHQLGFYGITGFMYGCAVSMLSHCWKYGEELHEWHNKGYNHQGDGVVNPAILTFKNKKR